MIIFKTEIRIFKLIQIKNKLKMKYREKIKSNKSKEIIYNYNLNNIINYYNKNKKIFLSYHQI